MLVILHLLDICLEGMIAKLAPSERWGEGKKGDTVALFYPDAPSSSRNIF